MPSIKTSNKRHMNVCNGTGKKAHKISTQTFMFLEDPGG